MRNAKTIHSSNHMGKFTEFHIYDLLILVALLSIMTIVFKNNKENLASYFNSLKDRSLTNIDDIHDFLEWSRILFEFTAIGMVGMLAFRICRPYANLGVLCREPGSLACFTGSFMLIMGIICNSVTITIDTYARSNHIVFDLEDLLSIMNFYGMQPYISYAIAGSWVQLAMRGDWRLGASWVEILGVCLGASWVLFIPIFVFTNMSGFGK